jgi:predicted DCC family thiol-disulfide oxidoreductase YuxK
MLLRPLNLLAYFRGSMRELGRYAAIVLIVPGGFLIALALWAFRHRVSLKASRLFAGNRLRWTAAAATAVRAEGAKHSTQGENSLPNNCP